MSTIIEGDENIAVTGPISPLITPITNCTDRTDKTFLKINRVLNDLAGAGSLFMGAGYCVAMCDLLHTILLHHGVRTHLVEVTLTVSYNQSNENRKTLAVGFDSGAAASTNSVQTHVVLLTQTEIPYLIDPSISHKLPHGRGAVIARCDPADVDYVSDFVDVDLDIRLTYKQKANPKVPSAHQSSILNRIYKDISLDKKLKILTNLVITALIISSLNFIRGTWDYYQTFIDTTNYWGPTHIKEIVERLEHLENKDKNSEQK